jgi:plasmid stabilization system protein ParE
MITDIVFKPDAIEDVRQIKKWYRSQKKGLEKEFAKELKVYINLLKKQEFLFQERYKNIRAIPLKRFPYLVYYFVDENIIYVIAVIAAKQDHENIIKKY